jgi:hypothetical protein
MRRWAYILTLAALWAASMAALVIALDALLAGHAIPFAGRVAMAGGWAAAFSSVSLAEEIAEWRAARGNRTGRLPCKWEGWA